MDWSRIESLEKVREFANKLCLACVGVAFACFGFVAVGAKASWLYGMSIAWGCITGGVVCVIVILLASLRISVLERRERTVSLDLVQRAADKRPPSSGS